MKKSLRQLVLIGLSATLLAGVAAPSVLAQDGETTDDTEQIEETSEEASDDLTEVSGDSASETETTETTDEVAAEASHAQAGVDEAITIFQNEYPEAHIEEIDVELDREDADATELIEEAEMTEEADDAEMVEDAEMTEETDEAEMVEDAEMTEEADEAEMVEDAEMTEETDDAEMTEEVVYNITINGFDADDNDFELEIEWVNGEIREQAFNEGMFNTDDTTDTAADLETDVPLDENAPDEAASDIAEETTTEEAATEEVTTEEVTTEEEAVTEEEAEDVERRSLDLESLLTLDEATEIAVAQYGEGEITHWNLTIDDPDWFEFWEEGYENPLKPIDVMTFS